LQLAVLEEAIARFRLLVATPSLKAPPGRARFEAFFRNYLAWIRGEEELAGCPFSAIGQDVRDRPGPLRELFLKSQNDWRAALMDAVKDAVRLKEFAAGTDAAQMAFEFIGIAFAYQQSLKIMEDRQSLKRANKAFAELLARAAA
jgi:AcrR family transcriptional regulator